MERLWAVLLVASVLAMAACGGDDSVISTGGGDGVGADTTAGNDGFVPIADTTPTTTPDSTTEDTGTDPGTPPPDTFTPDPGEFGYPCNSNADCFSGWCVVTPQGQVCTKTCSEACPDGWNCRQLVKGDPVFLCLPRWIHLCDPCNSASECASSESDTGHFCIDWGEKGKFCGGECKTDGICPWGYSCKDVPIGGGVIEKQCVPDSQECSCSPLAVQLQLETTCTVVNAFGACTGDRACLQNGLSQCDAPTPDAEKCNGQDDDCNGATDDLPPDYQCAKQNEFGTCVGSGTCVGGVEICTAPSAKPETCNGLDDDCNGQIDDGFADTDGDQLGDCVDEDDDNDGILDVSDNCPVVANPDQANNDGDDKGDACDEDDDNDSVSDDLDCAPLDGNVKPGAIELCDGVDNNCNGTTDENLCDDGNPCTDDSCQGTDCVHAPNNKLCDDGTVCTQSDKCEGGTCVGLNPLNCDDNKACTTDVCDPVVGCINTQLGNGAPCEDGSICTVNDFCQNGSCISGGSSNEVCDDNNPCTFDQCVPATGGCNHWPQTAPEFTNPSNSGFQACKAGNAGECRVWSCNGLTGACEQKNMADGAGCGEKEACPPCSGLLDCLFCEPDIPHVCSGGQCIADFTGVNCAEASCPGCNGLCLKGCGIGVCVPF